MSTDWWASVLWSVRLHKERKGQTHNAMTNYCNRSRDHAGVLTSRVSAKIMAANKSHAETHISIHSAHQRSCNNNNNKFSFECLSRNPRMPHNTKESFFLSSFRFSLQTCGSNLFWVICLGLIMSFRFLFWSTAGIWMWILESYTDNYPCSFGAFSFQTPWSLWEAAATLSWISATSKPANLYLFIAASEHISPPPPPHPPSRTKSLHPLNTPSTHTSCICVYMCAFD